MWREWRRRAPAAAAASLFARFGPGLGLAATTTAATAAPPWPPAVTRAFVVRLRSVVSHRVAPVPDDHGIGRAPPHLLDPDQLPFADEAPRGGDRDHVAVDLRDRIVLVVHVRLLDLHEPLLPRPEPPRAL